jgi:hypothetical protein
MKESVAKLLAHFPDFQTGVWIVELIRDYLVYFCAVNVLLLPLLSPGYPSAYTILCSKIQVSVQLLVIHEQIVEIYEA